MRQAVVGIVMSMLLGFALASWSHSQSELQAQQIPPHSPPAVKPLFLTEGMIAIGSDTADGRQQVAVIDSKTRVMSVYHIEHKSGTIALKSVRSLTADLEMDEFNTEHPLPREVRAMFNKR
jgi:hypothetical protein